MMNEIERGKNELEAIIGRLKACGQTNPMRAQLASSLKSIMTHVAYVSGKLDIWHVKRDEQKRYYTNKLSYQDVKYIYIEKGSICALFKKSGEQNTFRTTTKIFPIHWCIHDGIKNIFWDRWWMVFDAPPYNNHKDPMYFLKKLYCEFGSQIILIC